MVCQGVSQKEEKKKGVGEHGGGAEGRFFLGCKKRGKPRRRERSVCANTSQMPLFPFRPSRPSVGVVLPAHFSTFTSGQTAKKGGKGCEREEWRLSHEASHPFSL